MPKSFAFGLLLMRVAFGLVLALHGYHHAMDFSAFVRNAGGTGLALGAVAGELGGGLGLALGLLTRGAGAGLGTVMLAIAFTKQAAAMNALGTGPGTAFEFPFLCGVLGWAFAFIGAGDFSVDRLIFGKWEP